MPKKVMLVITKSNWGGAQRYVYDLATHLKGNLQPIVVLGGNGLLRKKLEGEGICTVPLSNLERDVKVFRDPTQVLFSLIQIIRKERPDVIHLNSSKAGGIGAFAARLLGVKKIIFTAHGFAFNEQRNLIQKLIIKCAVWLTIVLSHKTICVSENLKKQVTHWPFIKNKLFVIYNGVSAPLFFSKNEARMKLREVDGNLSLTSLWIGTVAELHPVKGLEYAIEALKHLSKVADIQYIIAGSGELRSLLEQKIRANNLEKSVILLGHVDDVPRYLKAIDIFLLPSISESFGIAVTEAGLAALPVIASSVGGISEIIENEKDGLLIPPRNPEEIGTALGRLIRNEPLRQTLGNALREKVARKFSKERMVAETLALYKN